MVTLVTQGHGLFRTPLVGNRYRSWQEEACQGKIVKFSTFLYLGCEACSEWGSTRPRQQHHKWLPQGELHVENLSTPCKRRPKSEAGEGNSRQVVAPVILAPYGSAAHPTNDFPRRAAEIMWTGGRSQRLPVHVSACTATSYGRIGSDAVECERTAWRYQAPGKARIEQPIGRRASGI